MDKSVLERHLSTLVDFQDPKPDLEQYRTPAWLAAHLIHQADLLDDVGGQRVIDFGCGTGMLSLAATAREPRCVVGIERDPAAIAVARDNQTMFEPKAPIEWVIGDVERLPLDCEDATVLMNPPFGAQSTNVGADKEFLAAAAEVATVSYSIHNAGSRRFVESFATDNGGTVTHAFSTEFEIFHRFEFHRDTARTIAAQVFRISWSPTK